MADEKKETGNGAQGTPALKGKALQDLKDDYAKASPKERLKNFKVDPVTKTLRRA